MRNIDVFCEYIENILKQRVIEQVSIPKYINLNLKKYKGTFLLTETKKTIEKLYNDLSNISLYSDI